METEKSFSGEEAEKDFCGRLFFLAAIFPFSNEKACLGVTAKTDFFYRLKRQASQKLDAFLGLRYKKDTLSFEKKNIFFGHATLLFKYFIYSIAQVYVKCNKKSRYRETPTVHGLSAFLCTCFLAKWLCDLKSAYETDADFFFGKYGDSFNDAVH